MEKQDHCQNDNQREGQALPEDHLLSDPRHAGNVIRLDLVNTLSAALFYADNLSLKICYGGLGLGGPEFCGSYLEFRCCQLRPDLGGGCRAGGC